MSLRRFKPMSRHAAAVKANQARQAALSAAERSAVASRAGTAAWASLGPEERSRIMIERAARRRKRQRRTTAARRSLAKRANAETPLEGGAEQLQAGGAADRTVEGPAGTSTAELLRKKGLL